jgi:hypothetical protein
MSVARPHFARTALILCAVMVLDACAPRGSLTLLTDEEITASARLELEDVERSVPTPGGPEIDVVQPSESQPVRAAIDIDLRFAARNDARIDPSTLSVVYAKEGFHKDLTGLIREHGGVSESAVTLHGARLPPGHHQLIVEIADNHGNVARRAINFEVSE